MLQTFASPRNRTTCIKDGIIHWQSERIGLLYRDEQSANEYWSAMESLRESVRGFSGQFISLDVAEPLTESIPEMFYAALKNAHWERSLPFSVPAVVWHNPHAAAPFINRAILWQRLCDLLLIEDEPNRETMLVLENIEQASPAAQHDVARLIRFHETHSIHRMFVLTLNRHEDKNIIPEMQDILCE